MLYILDTHTFLWFILDAPRLTPVAKTLIEDGNNEIYVSMASLWEIAIKTSLNKLVLPVKFEDFIPEQVLANHMQILPIEVPHLHKVATLPFHHRDPFDRLIIAQSMVENMPIVGRDVVFSQYAIKQIWETIEN